MKCLNCSNDLLTSKAKKFCSNSCQATYQYRKYIDEWLEGLHSGNKYEGEVSNHIRRWLHEKHKSRCSKCNWSEINPVTNKVPLTINHIDGNWNNSSHKNLELICPNCHSLTPNYGALNKGYGRIKRKKPLIDI